MPRNGSGGYDLPTNSWNPAVNGASATSTDYQALINDVETAIQQSVSADGQTPITGDFNFGGYELLNFEAESDLINFTPSGAGAVATDVQTKLREQVSVFDFCSEAQKADILAGTMALDCSVALQAFWDACSSDIQYGAPKGVLPPGRIKKTVALVCKKQFINIEGAGMWQTQIVTVGVGVAGMTTAAMPYLRPTLRNFGLVGDATTGKGMDFNNISIVFYLGSLEDLYLQAGDDAFYAPRFFSMGIKNVAAYSFNGHSFRAQCGPGVLWSNCYALTCGVGKAGYRLGGVINLQSCNGLNSGDTWGCFGNDTTSTDGFQGDFSANDLPDINLTGCNIEEFGSLTTGGMGIRVQNSYRNFNINGGKIDRFNLATAYKALIYMRRGPNSPGAPINLGFGSVFLGGGTPSDAHLYSEVSSTNFNDETRTLTALGVTTFKNAALVYPLPFKQITGDIYGDNAYKFSALTARRITVETLRYKELTITPVGANQDVDITGYTKIISTPAAASSIQRLNFSQTPGTSDDYLRNGEVIIEATNGNTTLIHNYGAGNGMRLTGGVNLTLAQGQVVRLMRSANYLAATAGWVQV
jgi:hypothetical protein